MVTRILSRKSIRGLLNYNEKKVSEGQAQLVLANQFGGDFNRLNFMQKLRRFEHLTILNDKTKTNALHIMLNFDPSEKPTNELLQKIAVNYMDRIGFGDQPYLVYRHFDAAHPHLHIVTTNIQQDGSRIDTHNLGRTLSEVARKALETEYGLVRAEGKKALDPNPIDVSILKKAEYGKAPTKRTVSSIVSAVTRQYAFCSLAELNAVLGLYQISAERGQEGTLMHHHGGLVYSILDKDKNRVGIPIKASFILGKPTLLKLEKMFERNREKRFSFKKPLQKSIKKILSDKPISREKFIHELRRENITVLFRQNDEGRTFGVTFVDHRNKTVFNGSALGKAFAAKALLEQFHPTVLPNIDQSIPDSATSQRHSFGTEENQTHKIAKNNSQNNPLLEELMAKPDFDPSSLMPRKKGKKKKRQFRL